MCKLEYRSQGETKLNQNLYINLISQQKFAIRDTFIKNRSVFKLRIE